MSLAEELSNLSKAHYNIKTSCKIQEFLDSSIFTDEDRETFALVLDNRSVYTTQILSLLRKRGLSAADATLNRHRRHDCSCYTNKISHD
jgi:hypothetical protein